MSVGMGIGTRKAVIVGTGALGLGFCAERLAGDYALHLSDISAKGETLRQLKREQGFTVNICGPEGAKPTPVTGSFTVSFTDTTDGRRALDRALADADIVLTATGKRFLPAVVSTIRSALNSRPSKVWLLFCENGLHIADTYAPGFERHVVPADTIMSRMSRFGEPEEIGFSAMWPGHRDRLVVEDYAFLPLDAGQCGAGGPFSPAFSLLSHEEFLLREDMKFFIHNGMHAFVAYRAFLLGVRRFPDVPSSIRREAQESMLTEVVPAITATHPVARREEIEQYGMEVLARIFNSFFNDSIERGVRGVEEKLDPSERLVGGCEYIRRAGIEPRGYEGTIAAAREILSRRPETRGVPPQR
jgi:mannitol-1-phosphate/altronate dehydrogenase